MKTGYDQFFKKAATAQKPAKAGAAQTRRSTGNRSTSAPPTAAARGASANQASRGMNSQQMAQQLRAQLAPKKRASRPFPFKMIMTSVIGLGITGFGLQNLEKVESYFKKVEISFLGQAYAEEAKKDEKTPKAAASLPEKKEAEGADKESPKAEAKKEFTAEEVNHFAKLNDRKRELDAKESELNKMEAELASQKVELEKRIQELENTRKNISQVLEQRVQADDKKVATLVEMYSNMKPQQAAKIFETLDEDLAVEILGRMKKKNAAEVMNLMKAEKAQIFSEKYAGYKRK